MFNSKLLNYRGVDSRKPPVQEAKYDAFDVCLIFLIHYLYVHPNVTDHGCSHLSGRFFAFNLRGDVVVNCVKFLAELLLSQQTFSEALGPSPMPNHHFMACNHSQMAGVWHCFTQMNHPLITISHHH